MNPYKQLSRVALSTANLNGSGGKSELSKHDIVHSLAGLNEHACNLAYWRYCGVDSAKTKLFEHLYKKARLHSIKTRLKDETVAKIVYVALEELEQPICKECNGKGAWLKVHVASDTKEVITCNKCGGNGKLFFTKARIAREIGIKKQSISDVHLNLFEAVRIWIATLHKEIGSHVYERLS